MSTVGTRSPEARFDAGLKWARIVVPSNERTFTSRACAGAAAHASATAAPTAPAADQIRRRASARLVPPTLPSILTSPAGVRGFIRGTLAPAPACGPATAPVAQQLGDLRVVVARLVQDGLGVLAERAGQAGGPCPAACARA